MSIKLTPAGPGRHWCPGGCGRKVADRFFACGPDWHRLPSGLRKEIWDTVGQLGPEREAAVAAAVEFYEAINRPRP